MDIFIVGVQEKPTPGSRLGSVFTAILLKQFSAFRHGDRFWYERDDHLHGTQETQGTQGDTWDAGDTRDSGDKGHKGT